MQLKLFKVVVANEERKAFAIRWLMEDYNDAVTTDETGSVKKVGIRFYWEQGRSAEGFSWYDDTSQEGSV